MSVEYDHDAIYKAYPNASRIFDAEGVFDIDDNKIELDQAKIDAARVELDKLKYRTDRTEDGTTRYPNFGDQLDMLWHDIDTGKLDKTGTFYDAIKKVKDANPKPS